MTETVAGTESPDFYGQTMAGEESPSPRLSSRRSSHEESCGSGSGRHHYRTGALSTVPERKSSMATGTTSVGATRNRPASLSPFRPTTTSSSSSSSSGSNSSKSKQRDDRCQRSGGGGGGSRSPTTDNCYESNPAAGSTIWRHPSSMSVNEPLPLPTPPPTSTSTSSGLFNWRKKYPRRSSSSSVVPTSSASSLFSSCVGAPPADPVVVNLSHGRTSQQQKPVQPPSRPVPPPPVPTRRNSQPAAFSLPQLVRRSLQPLISSSPSTDVDDQSDSVSKLRYMKCKQVAQSANCFQLVYCQLSVGLGLVCFNYLIIFG